MQRLHETKSLFLSHFHTICFLYQCPAVNIGKPHHWYYAAYDEHVVGVGCFSW